MNLVKTVLVFDDGSQQEFNAAPVVSSTVTVDSLVAAVTEALQTTMTTQAVSDASKINTDNPAVEAGVISTSDTTESETTQA